MDASTPLRAPVLAHPAKAKPDARPMRLALGAGGIAALSALATAIVLPPRVVVQVPAAVPPAQALAPQQSDTAAASGTPLQVQRAIKYVQLLPGQTAPPGATVIPATAPTPITVVVNVPAAAGKPAAGKPAAGNPVAAPTPIVVKTTQSGKVVP
jgi:hypothetical protein